MPSITTGVLPAHSRRPHWHGARPAIALTILTSLLLACAPTAPPAPTSAPAKPAEAAKPAAPVAPAPAAAPAAPAASAVAAAPTRPTPKGAVTIATAEEPLMLAAHDATASYNSQIMRNFDEALINRDPKTQELVPELATKWEQTNPTTWRFTLRQGVKFHDGSPFNAETAAEALNFMWAKENNFRIHGRIGPEFTVKPVSEYVIDVVLESPDPVLPARMYFAPLHSPKAQREAPDQTPLKPVGTGPYKFVEWVKGQYIKMTANPDWWGNTAPDAYGATTIKDVTFSFRVEREVRTAMVQRNEADVARFVSQEQCKSAAQCKGGPTVETILLRPDTMNPVLADKRVREALALAVDKNVIMNEILGGGEPASMLVRPEVVGYNPALKPYPYNPERAKQLIAEAKAAGVPVETTPLTLIVRRGAYFRVEEAAEAITDMLQKAGLTTLKPQVLETAKFSELYSGPPKPIAPERGILAVNSHGNELLDFAQTVGFYYICVGRPSTYCNPVTEEMQKNAEPLTGSERVKAYQAIAQYVHDDFVLVPIGAPSFWYAMSQRVEWTPRPDTFILAKEMTLKE
jgi:peptide/nickel transport system substrate-binding protein